MDKETIYKIAKNNLRERKRRPVAIGAAIGGAAGAGRSLGKLYQNREFLSMLARRSGRAPVALGMGLGAAISTGLGAGLGSLGGLAAKEIMEARGNKPLSRRR